MNRYRYLVRLKDAVNPLEFGGKAAQLNLAIQYKLPVPEGFVISDFLLTKFISGEISLQKELYLLQCRPITC